MNSFETDLKSVICRQNQSVVNLLEQYEEIKEVVDMYYIDKQKVKEAIENELICNCKRIREEETGYICEKCRLLNKLGLDEVK